MIRDDTLKRNMLAGRPEPTPVYWESLHAALVKLPARKTPLFRALPVSAVVFVAVAALCVVAVNNNTIAGLISGGSQPAGRQLAAGDVQSSSEAPSAAPETPEPTSSLKESEMPAATHPQDSAEPAESEFVTSFLNGEIDLRNMKQTNKASSGATAYGNKAYVQSIFTGSDAVIYECIVEDNKAGDLQRYFESHIGKEGNPQYKVLLKQKQDAGMLVFTICDGLVDKEYVVRTLTTEDLNLPIASDKDYPGRMYTQGIYAVMERSETGKFCIFVINVNPDYRPVSGFTIFSRYYSDTEEGGHKLEGTYALPIGDE